VPLLSRMVGTPLAVDIYAGAVATLAPLLADRRISAGGHVAVVVGPGQGETIAAALRPELANAQIHHIEGGSVEAAMQLARKLRAGFYDAVVGIGGGKTIDTAKYAATLSGRARIAPSGVRVTSIAVSKPPISLRTWSRFSASGTWVAIRDQPSDRAALW